MHELKIFEKKELEKLKDACEQTPNDLGYFYIVEWDNLVKIGSSNNPYRRYKELLHLAEGYGNTTIGRIAISYPHACFLENENVIHKFFSEVRKGNTELFYLSFEEAVGKIRDVAQMIKFGPRDAEREKAAERLMSGLRYFIGGDRSPEDHVVREDDVMTFDYLDRILTRNFPVSIYEIAEDYGMESQDFLAMLCDIGVYDTADLVSDNYRIGYEIAVFPTLRTHVSGAKTVGYNLRWTQRGQIKLYETLKKDGILPLMEQ